MFFTLLMWCTSSSFDEIVEVLSLFWSFVLPFVLCVRSYIPNSIHYHAFYLAFVGASGAFCVISVTFRYTGEAGSDGSQVLTSCVL
jgi:hypothetical protein